MGVLSVCAHGFVLGPILIVLLYNAISRDFARRHVVWFAGLGALWQLCCAIVGWLAMHALSLSSYRFSVLWNWRTPGSAYFELTATRLVFLFVIGMVSFVSALIAHKTVDRNRSSYTNLLMILLLGMIGGY